LKELHVGLIFPGMDPYLENPHFWPGIHTSFMVYLADHLQPLLRPRYIVAIETRVFVEAEDHEISPEICIPHSRIEFIPAEADSPELAQVRILEVHEPYITILDRQSNQRVVTVIEVLSPTNKYAGPGRESYEAKQQEVRGSDVHLVEIDLLRNGPHVLSVPERVVRGRGGYDYLICVNRAAKVRDVFEFYRRRVRERLPRIRVPLAGSDPDVILDLQAVLAHTYEAGSYGDRINYDAPCVPPLTAEDQAWANERIREARQGT
jgi:hypothetical protein